jgi:hypothetical protein
MAGLVHTLTMEALAAGAKRGDQPSFLERAKARWGKRHGGDDA